MNLETHFKFVRKDGTTRNGYQWPLVTPGQEPVRVEAPDATEHGDVCPHHDGDGLCVALTAYGASSGGISMTQAVGLWLKVDPDDVLARDSHKMRVRAVTVTGVFDQLALARAGFCTNLWGAYLRDADLRGAYLQGADLQDAYLQGANLQGANLQGADLQGADLQDAYLRDANLRDADLQGANLRDAYLQGADLQDAYLRGANLRGADMSEGWREVVTR